MGNAVQLIGRASIMAVYNKCGYDVFAFFQGKTPIISGCGADELEFWISQFEPAGSQATYDLRLYDGITISDLREDWNCAYTCSFGVKICDPYGGQGMIGGINNAMLKRLEALEKNNLATDDSDKIGDALMGWLEDPGKLMQVVGAVKGLFGMGGVQAPATMGAIAPVQAADNNLSPDDEKKYERLSTALADLERADPKILEGLEKLAMIANKKPAQYKMLRTMLDGY